VLAGFIVNDERGDQIRQSLYLKTAQVLRATAELGLAVPNTSGLPIVEVPVRSAPDIDAVARYLFDAGIYATIAAYPLVPRAEVGFRIQVTAANTEEEISALCDVLADLAAQDRLQVMGA
jgi:7-keto-8-aminopelargonate synthetase-like enzyme